MSEGATRAPGVTFVAADGFDAVALTDVWNRVYEGYHVPLAFSTAQLERHMRRSGVDVALSTVALTGGGEPFGLSLAARHGDAAWIGGFGIAPEFRRRGLAGRLIEAQLAGLDASGVAETRLEVIEANPARQLYVAAGFREQRRLLVLDGVLARGAQGPVVDLAPDRWAAAHRGLHRTAPVWRRRLPALEWVLAEGEASAVGVTRGSAIAGLAVAAMAPDGRLVLCDAAASDRQAGRNLLGALAARWPAAPVRLVDEPEGSPVADALLGAGFGVSLRQVEMARYGTPPNGLRNVRFL